MTEIDPRRAEEANRALWDEMAEIHFSGYPELRMLRAGEEILDPLELAEIGDVRGKTLLHLQCHIGTDTLAWARRGAIVTGVDFSARALALAAQLRDELGLAATFIHANLYDLPHRLDRRFDVVYTSRGVLCWLRDLEGWARVVARFLKPGGLFYLMESHPMLNALEETAPGMLTFVRSYFHREAPSMWPAGQADYADPSATLSHPTYEWDWALADLFQALISAGLRIVSFQEHDRLFHQHFPSMTTEDGRWYRMPGYEEKLPLMFTLSARKT